MCSSFFPKSFYSYFSIVENKACARALIWQLKKKRAVIPPTLYIFYNCKRKKSETLKPVAQMYVCTSKESHRLHRGSLMCCKRCFFLNHSPFFTIKPINYWSFTRGVRKWCKQCIQMTVLHSEEENYGDPWRMHRLSTWRVHHINIYTSLWKYANARQVIFPLLERIIKTIKVI